MKKKILVLVLLLVVTIGLTGCAKKDDKKKDDKKVAEWTIVYDNGKQALPKIASKAFKNATKKYTGETLEPVALLGTQVVNGTNYMILCKSVTATAEPVTSYKIVVVYNSLKDKASIKSVKDFDVKKYFNKEINLDNEVLEGGYTVYNKVTTNIAEEELKIFNTASETLTGATYLPITVLGKQDKNYAYLTVGTATVPDAISNISVVTVTNNDNKIEISKIANIDLKDFAE